MKNISLLDSFTLCKISDRKPEYFVTFSGGAMRFSNSCMDALQEPDYVQILIDKAGKRLAIRVVKANARPKFSFLHDWREKAEEAKSAGTRIPQKEAKITHCVNDLRQKLNVKGNQKFSGEFIEEEGIIVFDLNAAV